MSKKGILGECRICGTHTNLTFEHVPPKRAFNNRPVVCQKLMDIIGTEQEDDPTKGEINQKGVGAHTLCAKCNNDTGSWYGPAFVEWAYQGLSLIRMSKGTSLLYLNFNIFPLRVIKQICCMFCSVHQSGWADQEMRDFLLNRERRHIPKDWRVFVYFNTSPHIRQTGIVVRGSSQGLDCFSEISFPPFGYVLTKDSKPPDKRHQEITFFGKHSYNDWKHIPLKLPLLPVASWVPGDYRTKDELANDVARNRQWSREHPSPVRE